MIQFRNIHAALLSLVVLPGLSRGAQVEVTFEGVVFAAELHGFARGQQLSGRFLYDNAVPGQPGSIDSVRVFPAVLESEMRVGSTEYGQLGGPGEVTIFEQDPENRYVIFRSEPVPVLGPGMSGFLPLTLNLVILAGHGTIVPGLSLAEVATSYDLEDVIAEPGVTGAAILFQKGGDVVTGAAAHLTSLRARPYRPAPKALGRAIRLEDIVAGGDGSGTAPLENVGIDPRTGAFVTSYFEGFISDSDGLNPNPVADSGYIDSVFLMKGSLPTSQDGCNGCFIQRTTQSGVTLFVDDSEETNGGWNFILKNRIGGLSTPGIRVGGLDQFASSIGLHASEGITFNLDALRDRYGNDAVGCFSTFWGMDDCGTGLVRLYAMVSDDINGVTDIRNAVYGPGQGEAFNIAIPASSKYLTLASASVDGNMNCDHATIARPIITPLPCQPVTSAWIASVAPSRVNAGGETIVIEGENLSSFHSVRVGGVDLLDQQEVSGTVRRGRMPSLPAGVYDLEVTLFGSVIDRMPRAVEMASAPVILSVSPDQILTDRPGLCRVVGQNLRPDMDVLIPSSDEEAAPLHRQEFHSPELITGYIPWPVPPQLSISGTDSVFLRDQGRLREYPIGLLYVEIGLVGASPDLVPTGGGAVVTIEGLGFDPGMSFLVDSSPLLQIEIIDSTHARGKTPPLAAGLHSVSLVDGNGTTFRTVPGLLRAMQTPAPHITAILPLTVSTRGGDLVTILTDVWHGGATPRIGGASLGNIDATDPTRLRGEAPPLAPGFHDVDLVGLDGNVLFSLDGAVEAVEPSGMSISSVAPFEVATGGGTPMTFTGSGLEAGFTPLIGGLPLTAVEIVDTGHLRGLSPPLPEGPHDASLNEGQVERARFPQAVHAQPLIAASTVVFGRPPASRFAAGVDRIDIAATGVPANAVLRVGGAPVLPSGPLGPCGISGGDGGGGGIAGGGGHARFEGLVPDLPPGSYTVDFYLPGQGVVATLEDAVEIAPSSAAPRASHVVSAAAERDGSTRLHIFGSFFAQTTQFRLGGKPISDARVVSSRLAVGHAPALGPAEELGPRTLDVLDPRGNSSLAAAVVYGEVTDPPDLRFIRGDSNQSGSVDLSDAVTILGFLFLGRPTSLGCAEAADLDHGGKIDIGDPILLLNHLFLGGPPPRAPFPACGVVPPEPAFDCASFAACGSAGGAGGGAVEHLRANVFVLGEERASQGEPLLRDVSPVSREVVIDDPPGGLDLEPGDIIAGYVPVGSNAIHEGVTYLLKLGGERPASCLSTAAGDRTYIASPATLVDVFTDADIHVQIPNKAADVRLSSESIVANGNTLCDLAEEAGGAGASVDTGGGGAFSPLVDIDWHGMPTFTWEDGPNYVHAGFDRLRVFYAASEASLGVRLSGLEPTAVDYFSGISLDTEMQVFVDSHFEKTIAQEKKVLSIRKDHIVVVYGVPIHFAATGDLYAGFNLDAKVNLYGAAGARAKFKAGVGFRFDGSRIENLSGIDFPELDSVGKPELDLNGSLVARAYVRPETHLFAGILFRGLTADIGTRTEAFVRLHAQGGLQPVPCFDWGFDAGMKVTLIPEIQFFGMDLFDRTFDVIDLEKLNLIGGRYGCKAPPVPIVRSYVVALGGDRYEVHLDASASHDPDGGPLRFRWDFDADGQCDRATLYDPRTTVVLENVCPELFQVDPFKGCLRGRAMTLRVTDDEDVSVEHPFKVVLR